MGGVRAIVAEFFLFALLRHNFIKGRLRGVGWGALPVRRRDCDVVMSAGQSSWPSQGLSQSSSSSSSSSSSAEFADADSGGGGGGGAGGGGGGATQPVRKKAGPKRRKLKKGGATFEDD